MRVTFNAQYRNSTDAVTEAAAQLVARQREVSSGKRVHVPSDDPVAAASSVVERHELAVIDQYRHAADTAASRLSVVDGVLSDLIDQTTAAKVAVQSARGSAVTPAQREAGASQLLGIRDSVLSAIATRFHDTYPFSGNNPAVPPYVRTGPVISAYQGGTAALELDIDQQAVVQVGFSGDEILRGGEATDLLGVLDGLATAVRAGDDAAMQSGMDALDRAFSRISVVQTRVGAGLSAVDTHQEQLTTRRLSSQGRLSKIEDVDLAEAVSGMSRADTAYRAALGALNQASRPSLIDYLK